MAMNFSKDSKGEQVVFLLSSAGKTEDSMWRMNNDPKVLVSIKINSGAGKMT